ncbi:hypothetical protein [Agarilytica rhodophyticola]|uniref:hypothetical protein n=1 Tax=Agarilytica rhodophyticola TaxID=1737490 RepID=UPI000B342553|nr:hypothetical protein [Agarilytica rhodophyticola]
MPYQSVPTLGAGSRLYYEDPLTPDVWVLLPNALNIGQVGEQGETVEVTPILSTVREYIAGLDTPPDKQLNFNQTPGVPEYARFLELVNDRTNINMRVDYRSGDRATFNVALLGQMMEAPDGSTQLQMLIFAKQSGRTTWEEIPAPPATP